MRKFPLRALLIVPCLAQVIGTVTLVGWLSFRNGERAVSDLANQLMGEVAQRIDQNLQAYLDKPVQINNTNQAVAAQGLLPMADPKQWEQYLWRQAQIQPDINFIKVTSPDGTQWTGEKLATGELRINIISEETKRRFHSYQTDSQGRPIKLVTNLEIPDTRRGAWYLEPATAGRRLWSSVFTSFLEEELLIAISDPVKDPTTQELTGVFNAAIRLSSIGNFLKTLKIGRTGQAFIVEQRSDNPGVMLASSTGELPFLKNSTTGERELFPAAQSRNPLTRAAIRDLLERYTYIENIQEFTQETFHFEREKQFLTATPFEDTYGLRWLIVVVVPQSDFMAEIQQNNQRTALLCLVAVAVATGLGIWVARWIVQPLTSLNQAAQAIAAGDLTQTIDEEFTHTHEVSQLTRAFNSMSAQLLESFSTLEERVVERTAALLTANERLRQEVKERQEAQEALKLEQDKVEELLLNVLPKPIAERLKRDDDLIADDFDEVTILFADIVDFTPLSARMPPRGLLYLLNSIFCQFDALVERFELEKIKTIGDAYMVAAGLPIHRPDHAEAIADLALGMQDVIQQFQSSTGHPYQIRIGINTGMVVAGVVGTKKFIYDLWGDAVNVASRMESHGLAGEIQVTEFTYHLLKDQFDLEYRGEISIKGRGLMKTYWLRGRKTADLPSLLSLAP